MSEPNSIESTPPPAAPEPPRKRDEAPEVIKIVPYPKIVFLYPTLIAAFIAAVYLSIAGAPDWVPPAPAAQAGSDTPAPEVARARGASITTVFLIVLALNLVILAFDFPRTISLTLFFFVVAVAMALWLLFLKRPDLLPAVSALLHQYQPLANATFFWTVTGVLGVLFFLAYCTTRFDYWEVRRNELLHHHGILSNLERFPAPNLRIDKEITDVFEYLLLGSGRLILQISSERRAIILDNVPFISRKESALTRMLGALHVELADENHPGPF